MGFHAKEAKKYGKNVKAVGYWLLAFGYWLLAVGKIPSLIFLCWNFYFIFEVWNAVG